MKWIYDDGKLKIFTKNNKNALRLLIKGEGKEKKKYRGKHFFLGDWMSLK